MLDVIPSGDAGSFKRGRKTRPSKHVLKVDWRVPARLRRPVRQQVAGVGRRKKNRMVSGFYPRPLTTQKLSGDLYRGSAPRIQVSAPPYLGRAARGASVASASAITTPFPRSRSVLPLPANPAGKLQGEKVSERSEDGGGAGAVVQKPKRLKLPFRVDFLGAVPSHVSFRKIPLRKLNLGILLVGCLIAAGFIWNLQGAGRAFAVLGSVVARAEGAYSRLSDARAALAETDFASSEAAFGDAQELLTQARGELEEALATSRYALRAADVTGTLASGQALLTAGERLTKAGQHMSRGLGLLFSSEVTAEGEQIGSPTLVTALQEARGELTEASRLVHEANELIQKTGGGLLPEQSQEQVQQLKEQLPTVENLLGDFLQQSELLLEVLGAERQRDYLLLFANNHELRPVGGFIGSVGLVNVDRGVVEEIDVQTVYDGDGQLKEYIAPPDPLLPITDRWYLRDSNWFVDWPVSARKAAGFFEKEGGPTVDGVILLTPNVIRDLLALTGPIEVPGYDIEISSDNFFEVTQHEVTYGYDKELNQPKQFLADLTPLLLNKLFVGEEDRKLELLGALTRSLGRKDMVLYFRDDNLQEQVENVGWAGAVPQDKLGFLYVNNANIGGHKSDQFIEQEIDYRADVGKGGDVEVTLAIRRTHRGPQEKGDYEYPGGEDPSRKDNVVYQRVLVPQGAELFDAHGFASQSQIPRLVKINEDVQYVADADVAEWQVGQEIHKTGTKIGEEAGYTFFGNWVITKPGETSVGLYRYVIPGAAEIPGILGSAGSARLYIAKQPGDARSQVRAAIQLPEGYRIIHSVPQSGATQHSAREMAYRADLSGGDVLTGVVFEEE